MPDDDAFDDSGYMIRDGKRTDPAAERAEKERNNSVTVTVPGRNGGRPIKYSGFNSHEIAGFISPGEPTPTKRKRPTAPKPPADLGELLGPPSSDAPMVRKRRRPIKRLNVSQASIGEMGESGNGGAGSEQ